MATNDENDITKLTLWREARIAERVPRVHERHKTKSKALASFDPALLATALSFLALYQALVSLASNTRAAQRVLRRLVNALLREMRRWGAPLTRDIPDFDGAQLTTSQVVSDVVRHARYMIEQAGSRADSAEGALPYAEDLTSELTSLIEPVEAAVGSYEALRVQLQEAQAETRRAAAEFHVQLVPYRRVLRSILGGSHHDYRTLLAGPIPRGEADDEPPVEVVADPDQPPTPPAGDENAA